MRAVAMAFVIISNYMRMVVQGLCEGLAEEADHEKSCASVCKKAVVDLG